MPFIVSTVSKTVQAVATTVALSTPTYEKVCIDHSLKILGIRFNDPVLTCYERPIEPEPIKIIND